jgi:hypothetical protein
VNNDNYLAGREVRPEQWAFDQALATALKQGPLSQAFAGHQDLMARRPQWGMHFGINFAALDQWEAAVERVQNAGSYTPSLDGRVRMLRVFRPDDPEPFSSVHQAFFWTDILASGSLAFGQRIELAALIGEPKLS